MTRMVSARAYQPPFLARMMHDGSSPFDKAQGPDHSRGTKAPESAFLVKRISCMCFEFHVSGFKLFESDW